MPRNDFYPYQKPYYQEESYIYNDYENYDDDQTPSYSNSKHEHKPHHCCPCPCPPWPKPEPKPHCCCPPCPKPKPEPKHECKLISAQLSKDDEQKVAEGEAFKFDAFIDVSTNNPNAPLYYNTANRTVTFKKAGRFIVTYGTDVHFEDDYENDVRLALVLTGVTQNLSISHGRNTDNQKDGRQTLTKCVLINVVAGATLKLVALTNDKDDKNEFRHTVLVIDEKCKMDNKCD